MVEGIKGETIDALVGQVRTGEHRCGAVLIAAGQAAKEGEDAQVEFLVDPQRLAGKEREDGSLDFREVNFTPTVRAGQVVARRRGATLGHPGMTVKGRRLAARDGRQQRLVAGENVEMRYEEGQEVFYATVAGVNQDNLLKLDRMRTGVDGAYNQLRRLVGHFGLTNLDVGQIKNMIAAAIGARRQVLVNKAKQLGEIARLYQQMQKACQQLEREIAAQVQGAEIRVYERAFPGVEIRLGEHRRQLTEIVEAPHFRLVGDELVER